MRQFLWLVVLVVVLGGCKEVTERGGAKVMPGEPESVAESIEKINRVAQAEEAERVLPYGFTLIHANGDYDTLVVTFNQNYCENGVEEIRFLNGRGQQSLGFMGYDCGLVMASSLAQYSSQFQFVDPITPIQSTSGVGSFTSGFVVRVVRK